jgi:hypothetical protein
MLPQHLNAAVAHLSAFAPQQLDPSLACEVSTQPAAASRSQQAAVGAALGVHAHSAGGPVTPRLLVLLALPGPLAGCLLAPLPGNGRGPVS